MMITKRGLKWLNLLGLPISLYYNINNFSEARKRSYLVGSVGATSLLGTQELEKLFPDRKLR